MGQGGNSGATGEFDLNAPTGDLHSKLPGCHCARTISRNEPSIATDHNHFAEATSSEINTAKPAYYTCVMHPSVKKHNPTDKCSIDLIPVMKKNAIDANATNAVSTTTGSGEDKPGEFTVPVERQQLIGVTCAAIQK